jgi:hypothetical protein
MSRPDSGSDIAGLYPKPGQSQQRGKKRTEDGGLRMEERKGRRKTEEPEERTEE